MMVQLIWFKRDLRTTDHRPLYEASLAGPVLPLYIVEPDYWALPESSSRQYRALGTVLEELHTRLGQLGAPLIIRQGRAVDCLSRIHRAVGISRILAHEETGGSWSFARDQEVRAFCRSLAIPMQEYPQFGVVRGLKDRDEWGARHDSWMRAEIWPEPNHLTPVDGAVPRGLPSAESLGLVADGCPAPQSATRQSALALLESFLAGRGADYRRAMSSPLGGAEACSRLSVALAHGSLSMRETFRHLTAARRNLAAMPLALRPIPVTAIDSLVARLHWHCHFIQKLESQPDLDFVSMNRIHQRARRLTALDDPLLEDWATGMTGFPFVDACMRSLIQSGWLNFRMRAMLVAFACYHFGLDWRAVGIRLARYFTDYEPGIHWPQVQMQAGQTGINTPRLYNPVKQGLDQDPDGIFTRRWLPELRQVPLAFLQQPWRLDPLQQQLYGCIIGRDYPAPKIDHEQAARDARNRLTAIRAQEGYRSEANRVFLLHGSRKRQRNQDDPARALRRAAKKPPERQMSFDL